MVTAATSAGAPARAGPAPRVRSDTPAPTRIRASAVALVLLVLGQIYLGALVAGLRAGLLYNTWPLIDGRLVPDAATLFFDVPWWRNLFENALTVQFDHRMAAYALWALALVHAIDTVRAGRGTPAVRGAIALATAITLQAALGIWTLLDVAPLALALSHQAMAMMVLTLAVMHAQRLSARGERAVMAAPNALSST